MYKEALLKIRILLSAIIISLLAPLSVVAQQPQEATGTQFIYKFKAGEKQRQKMVMKIQMNLDLPTLPGAPPNMGFTMAMVAVMRSKTLGILPNGDAKVLITYESLKADMDMPGMPGIPKDEMAKMQKEISKNLPTVKLIMTRYGQIVGMEGLQNLQGMQGMPQMDFTKMFGNSGMWANVFPDQPVFPGDAWTQDLPMFGAGNIAIDSILESVNTRVGNHIAAKIKQDYSGHIELADLMKAFAPAMSNQKIPMPDVAGGMDISGWGVTYFDHAKGKLVRSDANIDVVMNISAQACADQRAGTGPQSFDMSFNAKMTMNIITLPN